MQLRYIELDNFLGHEHEALSIPEEGMFVLTGDSGAGKSSLVVDAIGFALYGPNATRSRRQAELVNRDHQGEAMSVRVMFDLGGGESLVVSRGLDERGHSWAKAYEPDSEDPTASRLLAEGAQPVARLVRARLGGMSFQQFYAAFVARQSEIALLTSLKGAERKERIHRMLGMRELEKSADLISSGLRRAKAEVDQLERSLGGIDLDQRRHSMAQAAEELKTRRQQAQENETELGKLERRIAKIQGELEPLQADAERVAERVRIDGELERADELLARSRKAEAVISREGEIKQAHASASGRREELLVRYQRSLEHAGERERAAALEEQRAELRARLLAALPVAVSASAGSEAEALDPRALRAEAERLEAEASALAEREAELAEQLTRLRDTGECYACLRGFESEREHGRVVAELEHRLAASVAEREAKSDRRQLISALYPDLEALEDAEQGLRRVHQRIGEIESEGGISNDLDALKAEGVETAQTVDRLGAELSLIAKAHEDLDPGIGERVAELRRQRSALGVAPLGGTERKLELEGKLTSCRRELALLEGAGTEVERSLEAAIKELERQRGELEGFEHEITALEKLRQRMRAHEHLQTMLRGYQRRLADEIRPALSEIGSEMLQRISGGRHRALKISEDYEIEVETREGFTLPSAMLSGGEQIRANICLRLALTRLVSQRTGVPVGFLVFDEPLPSQDPGHVDRILELLESLRPFYRQQFIISHVGELRHADEIDYVIEFASGPGKDRVELVAA